MTVETFKCEHCGTETEYEYDGCGSYSAMFNSGERTTVHCKNRDCRKPVGTVTEY